VSEAAVTALVVALARAFGLAVEEVLAFVRQRHPELRDPPPAPARDAIDARVDAAIDAEERRRAVAVYGEEAED
jgi:hypothetical protein